MKVSTSVRQLADFVHRRGDIFARLEGRTLAEEGICTQRKLQQHRGDGYSREQAIRYDFERDGLEITVSGRADGCDLSQRVVEEIKATRSEPEQLHAHLGSVHWAQLKLYAAVLSKTSPPDQSWRLRLLYCHPDTLFTTPFEVILTTQVLGEFLDKTLNEYADWLGERARERERRDAELVCLEFPYAEFRPHQRALARRVFQTLDSKGGLLLEAPTGSGKTMGVLYPALRALTSERFDKHLYLTSRSTGARAVLQACNDLDPDDRFLIRVQITAKEKACLVEGMPCDPERCRYAAGYYDRIKDAVRALLAVRNADAEAIQQIAEVHQVCPFELSLDTAQWADLVVADYNYVFDPVVRLQRFAERPDLGLLVDESHQLAERAQSMLSLALERTSIQRAMNDEPPEPLLRSLRSIDRALLELRRSLNDNQETVIEPPTSLLRAVTRFTERLGQADVELDAMPAFKELVFNLGRWSRADTWVEPERFVYTAERQARRVVVRLLCLDPSRHLAAVLGGFGGNVRFSGTVSPLPLYQRLHGQDHGACERVASPFTIDQLQVLIVPDVPVYWRQREASLPRLVALVADVTARTGVCPAEPGNYLVALPSFAYLDRFVDAFCAAHPERRVLAQRPGMNPDQRQRFLEDLQKPASGSIGTIGGIGVIGVVVLGGIFGESVDFAAAPLAGIVCVGVGLPPPSLEREQRAAYHDQGQDAQRGRGYEVAYLQPAMTKILQMAGRLLRSSNDRGFLCLVDERYLEPTVSRFYPDHWQPVAVAAADVGARLRKFWRGEERPPRLPRSATNQAPPTP